MKTQPKKGLELESECVLDEDVRFEPYLPERDRPPRAVFVTGGTGFVGVYLLAECLRQSDALVYCLVRANTPDAGKQRLAEQLSRYGLWNDRFMARIVPVPGDLSLPLFGLSEPDFQNLADRVDVIYHSGAVLNSVFPYPALKAPNVTGTRTVIHLAALHKTRPVHFVSTIAVFFSRDHFQKREIYETETPCGADSLIGGYRQSKRVAEQLLCLARERGMPLCIYRPVRVFGASGTGMTPFKDSLCHLLKVCIELNRYPVLNTALNLIPVDYAAKAIISIASRTERLNNAFHLSHPAPITWRSFFDVVCSCGYDMKEVPFGQWYEDVKERSTRHAGRESYAVLAVILKDPHNLILSDMRIDSSRTDEALAGSAITCPPLGRALISTYLRWFQRSGQIPAG